jgi:hypothetical protein
MRLPEFTAAATLTPPTTFGRWNGPVLPTSAEVGPASLSLSTCLRECERGGGDGCFAHCSCIARGVSPSHCPVIF